MNSTWVTGMDDLTEYEKDLALAIVSVITGRVPRYAQILDERVVAVRIAKMMRARRDDELTALRLHIVELADFAKQLDTLAVRAGNAAAEAQARGNGEQADHEYGRRSGLKEAASEFRALLSIAADQSYDAEITRLDVMVHERTTQLQEALKRALIQLHDTNESLLHEIGDTEEGQLAETSAWAKTTWLDLLPGEPFGLPEVETIHDQTQST